VRLPQSFQFVNHLKEVILKMKFGKIGLTCATLFLLSAVSIAAFAQDNGAGAAPAGGGRQGRGQRGQGGFNRAPSLATIPVSTLNTYLKLTADQKTKIEAIQAQYKEAAKAFTPAPGGAGAQADPQAAADMRQKRQEATTKTESDIKAILTDDQTKLLEPMNKELVTYQAVGIPAGVLGELKLTDGEHLKISTIADDSAKERTAKMADLQANGGGDRQAMMQAMQDLQKATHEKIMAVLTTSQKAILEAYLKDHPQPQFGRGGGGGGRRGGAGAAPPPPAH
jgi:hypothetical protein